MQNVGKGFIVRTNFGHDKNEVFAIIAVDNNFIYLANGKNRSIEKPKKKNIKHIEVLGKSEERSELLNSSKLNNSHIIKILKDYR